MDPLLRRAEPALPPAGSQAAPYPDPGADSADCVPTGSLEPTPRPGSDTPPTGAGRIPVQVGVYAILGEVAVGGMGVVYKARHQTDGTMVALKMMRSDIVGNPEQAQRFHREILAAARLHHVNIVPILDVGWHEGKPFYTMPFRAGNLGTLRKQPAGDIKAIIAVMEKVARGVQHAHEQDVLHRDLKPGNVLLDEHGEPAVTDFGLAKLHDTDLELTQTGSVMGTWPYMSPEQADGRTRDLGPATDIWALGVMLYELLAGQRPFVGEDRNELREKIQAARPTPLRTLRPDVSWELEMIVHRCLQKKAARRYPSAAALADDLRRWQRGERIARPWPIRRAVAAMAAVAILAVGVAAAVYLMPDRQSQEEPEKGKDPNTPIVLIGDDGPPSREFRCVVGEKDASIVAHKPGQLFTVGSTKIGVLELLSDPPWDHFRFEARVSQRNLKDGRAGIVFGHRRFLAGKEPCNVFWYFSFRDDGISRGGRSLSIGTHREGFDSVLINGLSPGFEPAFGAERLLAVEVSPAGISAVWGPGKLCVATATAIEVTKLVERFYDADAPQRERPSRGGVGLFVKNGNATFRHVSIRPLP